MKGKQAQVIEMCISKTLSNAKHSSTLSLYVLINCYYGRYKNTKEVRTLKGPAGEKRESYVWCLYVTFSLAQKFNVDTKNTLVQPYKWTHVCTNELYKAISAMQSRHTEGFFIISGDFTNVNLNQYVDFSARGANILHLVYINAKSAYIVGLGQHKLIDVNVLLWCIRLKKQRGRIWSQYRLPRAANS